MSSRFTSPNAKRARLVPACLAVAGFAALISAVNPAGAAGRHSLREVESVATRTAGEPIMAIVSLHSQMVTVYDPKGWILRAPVSTGQKGRETPAGIFSVIQKQAEHYSNLYDDAFMPHMQRITWSGIALHGGALPGYPASHGCIRMPFDFAAQLFEETPLGLRVIVAPTDVEPIEIAHPALFPSKPADGALAAARAAAADEATRMADLARLAAGVAFREVAQATAPVRVAENLTLRAKEQLAAAEAALGSAGSADAKERAESAKAQAVARISELQEQWAAAKAKLQPRLEALATAREAAVVAETAQAAAAEAVRQMARALEPVSVLISRKTQRLYVRQAFEPIFDSPVTIRDADRPIGTHIFTAIERANGETDLRWNVVSLQSRRPHGGAVEPKSRARGSEGRDVEQLTDPAGAKNVLDRIVIPQEALDRLGTIAPRSSLIVTDEGLSSETGKGTDFVVLLSGEPQGGIKIRRRDPGSEFSYAPYDSLPVWRLPFTGRSAW
jgi:hypothetical protein